VGLRFAVRCVLACALVLLGLAPAASAQLTASSGEPFAAAAAETGHVLIFSETAAFRHTEAIEQGTPKLQEALAAAGVTSD
jgi:hypothetical protein